MEKEPEREGEKDENKWTWVKKKIGRLVCIFKGYNGVFWNMIKIFWGVNVQRNEENIHKKKEVKELLLHKLDYLWF